MLKLRFRNNKQNAVWLVEPKVVIGSSSDCDLVLDSRAAESKHVAILIQHETLQLRPLIDSKVLKLNGNNILGTKAQPLKVNDVVAIGAVELEVVDPKQERSAAPTISRQEKNSGWALKANHTALANRVFTLKQETIVGRSNECDITLAAAHLSRRHAKLVIKGGALYVQDLGSSNGTFVNGKAVAEARVKRGDELRFDTLSFGVIGPADDELDKTTVRSVGAPKVKSTAQQAKPKRAVTKATSAPVTKVQKTPEVAQEAASESSGGSSYLALIGLALLIGGVYYAKVQGLF